MTARFARPDGSTTAKCDPVGKYCGGTYQGIIKQLDYIQNMGFTAVSSHRRGVEPLNGKR
jgi:alpha-amylase